MARSRGTTGKDAERRLLAAFSLGARPAFAVQSLGGTGGGDPAPASAPASASDPSNPGGIDTARLIAAVTQVDLLAAGARSGLAGDDYPAATRAVLSPDEIARIEDEAAALREIARRLIAGTAVPGSAAVRIRVQALIESDGSRPAALIQGGRLLAPGALGEFGSNFAASLIDADAAVAATGRIALGGRQCGSGVLVDLARGNAREFGVLTARHVAQELVGPAGWPAFADAAEIDFKAEIGAGGTARHRLLRVIAAAADPVSGTTLFDAWDYALLELGAPLDGSALPAPAPIDLAGFILAPAARAAIIGYPAKPAVATSELAPGGIWHKLFGGAWHVKRLSPAIILDPATRAGFETLDPRMLLHDATTTGGSSGGALLGIGGGALSAIHIGGRPGTANLAQRLAAVFADQGWAG